MNKNISRKIKIIGIIFVIVTFISFFASVPILEMFYSYYSKGYSTDQITGETTILSVTAGTPADSAGLQKGDIIKKVNGGSIGSTEDYISIISRNIGRVVQIEVLRSGKALQVQLVPRENYPQGQGSTGILIANETKTVDQNTLEKLSTAIVKSYSGYESIPEIPAELAGRVGIFTLSPNVLNKNYVYYKYTGNFRYFYQSILTIFLLITTIGVLKRKKWSVYLAILQGLITSGFLIYLLFMIFKTTGSFKLNSIYYLALTLELGFDLLFIYFAYYLYKNKEQLT